MTTTSSSLHTNCKTIPLLSGFGNTKTRGLISLQEGEEYISHQIEQEPSNAGYTVALRLIVGKTDCRNKEIDANRFSIGGNVQFGGKPGSIGLHVEKSNEKSTQSSTSIQTTARLIELTVSGGTSSCCGFGKESSFKLSVVTSKQRV